MSPEKIVEIVDIATTGTKEAYDLGVAVKKIIVKAVECKRDDGEITGEEYGEIATTSFREIMDAVDGIGNLPEEAKQKPLALTRAVTIPVSEAVEAILEK